jgi:hypothetical protein
MAMNASDDGLIVRGIEWVMACEAQPLGALMHRQGMKAELSNGALVEFTVFPPALTLTAPRNHHRESVRDVTDEECEWLEGLLRERKLKIRGKWQHDRGRAWALDMHVAEPVRGLVRAYWAGCPDHRGDLQCPCGWAERGSRLAILPHGWRPPGDPGPRR